jgi:hypothetical protein
MDPRVHVNGHAGQTGQGYVGLALGRACPQTRMVHRPEALVDGRKRMGSRGKWGGAHPEDVDRASRGGCHWRAANRAAADLGTCRETAMGGGDSGNLGLIPSMGKLLGMRQSSWATRRSSRRCKTAGKWGAHQARIRLTRA